MLSLSANFNWDGHGLLACMTEGGMQVMEIKVPTVGGLVSDWFQNTLPAALEREASRVRVT